MTLARDEHKVLYKELSALLAKHPSITAEEALAVASNLVGKVLALQDQRTMTKQRAFTIVLRNIEAGNEEVVSEMENMETKGGVT